MADLDYVAADIPVVNKNHGDIAKDVLLLELVAFYPGLYDVDTSEDSMVEVGQSIYLLSILLKALTCSTKNALQVLSVKDRDKVEKNISDLKKQLQDARSRFVNGTNEAISKDLPKISVEMFGDFNKKIEIFKKACIQNFDFDVALNREVDKVTDTIREMHLCDSCIDNFVLLTSIYEAIKHMPCQKNDMECIRRYVSKSSVVGATTQEMDDVFYGGIGRDILIHKYQWTFLTDLLTE